MVLTAILSDISTSPCTVGLTARADGVAAPIFAETERDALSGSFGETPWAAARLD